MLLAMTLAVQMLHKHHFSVQCHIAGLAIKMTRRCPIDGCVALHFLDSRQKFDNARSDALHNRIGVGIRRIGSNAGSTQALCVSTSFEMIGHLVFGRNRDIADSAKYVRVGLNDWREACAYS